MFLLNLFIQTDLISWKLMIIFKKKKLMLAYIIVDNRFHKGYTILKGNEKLASYIHLAFRDKITIIWLLQSLYLSCLY